MVTLVLLDGFLDSFSKFLLIIVEICILIWYFWVIFENYTMRMLIIYVETILSHTEFIEYDFQKTGVTGPWDHKVLVSAKKV